MAAAGGLSSLACAAGLDSEWVWMTPHLPCKPEAQARGIREAFPCGNRHSLACAAGLDERRTSVAVACKHDRSHTSPKRKREESAMMPVWQPAFPRLRSGLG